VFGGLGFDCGLSGCIRQNIHKQCSYTDDAGDRMSSGELTDSPIPVEIVLNHWSELGYTTCPGFITIQTQVTERKVRLVVPNHKPPFLIGLSSGVSSSVVSQVLNTKQHNHVTEREA
jgi:hypothetical protein